MSYRPFGIRGAADFAWLGRSIVLLIHSEIETGRHCAGLNKFHASEHDLQAGQNPRGDAAHREEGKGDASLGY
jgi:hypothetical protein